MLNGFLKFVGGKWTNTTVSEVNPLPVNIVSSSNPLPVGGKSLTSTCIFTRPADTTAYAAQLLVASGVTLNGTLAFSAQHQTKTVIPIGSGVFDVIG